MSRDQDELQRRRAQNAKLRAALEFYAPMTGYTAGIEVDDLGSVVREALVACDASDRSLADT